MSKPGIEDEDKKKDLDWLGTLKRKKTAYDGMNKTYENLEKFYKAVTQRAGVTTEEIELYNSLNSEILKLTQSASAPSELAKKEKELKAHTKKLQKKIDKVNKLYKETEKKIADAEKKIKNLNQGSKEYKKLEEEIISAKNRFTPEEKEVFEKGKLNIGTISEHYKDLYTPDGGKAKNLATNQLTTEEAEFYQEIEEKEDADLTEKDYQEIRRLRGLAEKRLKEKPLLEFVEANKGYLEDLKFVSSTGPIANYLNEVLEGKVKLNKPLTAQERVNLETIVAAMKKLDAVRDAQQAFCEHLEKYVNNPSQASYTDAMKSLDSYLEKVGEYTRDTYGYNDLEHLPLPTEVRQKLSGHLNENPANNEYSKILSNSDMGGFFIKPTQNVAKYVTTLKEISGVVSGVNKTQYENMQAKFIEANAKSNELQREGRLKKQAGVKQAEEKFEDGLKTTGNIQIGLELKDNNKKERKEIKTLLRGYDRREIAKQQKEEIKQAKEHKGRKQKLTKEETTSIKTRVILNQQKTAQQTLGMGEGYVIVEKAKQFGDLKDKRSRFTVKDANRQDVFKVIVSAKGIIIQEVGGLEIQGAQYKQRLKAMHTLITGLRRDLPQQPILVTSDPEKIGKIRELAVNAEKGSPIIYQHKQQNKDDVLQAAAEQSRKALPTVSKEAPVIVPIAYKGKISGSTLLHKEAQKKEDDKIRERFQQEIDTGISVPVLNDPSQTDMVAKRQGALQSEKPIRISTTDPLIAIKQYESCLAAGFKPEFTPETKKKVKAYVSEGVQNSFGELSKNQNVTIERQILISAPKKQDANLDGGEILKRTIAATNDGFLVAHQLEAQKAMRDHVATMTDFSSMNYALRDDPTPAMVIRNLIGLGIKPDLPADPKKREEIRKQLEFIESGEPLVINSGNPKRDFELMKFCVEELGIAVKLQTKEQQQAVFDLPENRGQTWDLTRLSEYNQTVQLPILCYLGIGGKANITTPQSSELEIRAKNEKEATNLFRLNLNQGFMPKFSEDGKLRERMAVHTKDYPLQVRVDGNDPKDLINRVQQCIKQGFFPTLNEAQITILKDHLKSEQKPSMLMIEDSHVDTINANLELAQKLGIEFTMKPEALKRYQEAQKELSNGKREPLSVNLYPVMDNKGKVDLDKTLQRAKKLDGVGIHYQLSPEMIGLIANASKESKKTTVFGGKPTETAIKNKTFLEELNKTNESNTQYAKKGEAKPSVSTSFAPPTEIPQPPTPSVRQSFLLQSPRKTTPPQSTQTDPKANALSNIDIMIQGFTGIMNKTNQIQRIKEDAKTILDYLNAQNDLLKKGEITPEDVNKNLGEIFSQREHIAEIKPRLDKMREQMKELPESRTNYRP